MIYFSLTLTQGQISRSNRMSTKPGIISQNLFDPDFILGTKIQPNKAHLMTQVPMTLTEVQGHRSRSNVPKLAKMGHISNAISPTDFMLGTKVQPNKSHSMTQVPRSRSRSNFPKMGKKLKN